MAKTKYHHLRDPFVFTFQQFLIKLSNRYRLFFFFFIYFYCGPSSFFPCFRADIKSMHLITKSNSYRSFNHRVMFVFRAGLRTRLITQNNCLVCALYQSVFFMNLCVIHSFINITKQLFWFLKDDNLVVWRNSSRDLVFRNDHITPNEIQLKQDSPWPFQAVKIKTA